MPEEVISCVRATTGIAAPTAVGIRQYPLVMALPAHARAWLRQRESGAVALTAIEDAELRHLDDAAALAQSEALLAATPLNDVAAERRSTSGFVEQQRIFARARR